MMNKILVSKGKIISDSDRVKIDGNVINLISNDIYMIEYEDIDEINLCFNVDGGVKATLCESSFLDNIKVNNKYVDEFKDVLNEYGYNYTEGMTWTTDAFYRETRKKVESRVALGAKCVEMECSALQAVADFRGFDFFTFFTAGDNLDLPEWDKRSLSGDVKLDEKSRIAILALELGYKISNDMI